LRRMAVMNQNEFVESLSSMEPERAAEFLRPAMSQVLAGLDDSGKMDFLLSLLGSAERDKLASMVHL